MKSTKAKAAKRAAVFAALWIDPIYLALDARKTRMWRWLDVCLARREDCSRPRRWYETTLRSIARYEDRALRRAGLL